MITDPLLLTFALLALAGWGYLALFHDRFWKLLVDVRTPFEPTSWPSVAIIVPARNEEETIAACVSSLLSQDYAGDFSLILVNDHSSDATGQRATEAAAACGKTDRLTVITAPDLQEGWSGKVSAMKAGFAASSSDYVLFTDADIQHDKDSLSRLMARSLFEKLDLNSLMVKLHCASEAEKLLIPAFVFFFMMLYPFQRANRTSSRVAAAAGGVMLARSEAIRTIGGLDAIKGALIDDCALAHAIKTCGGKGQTEGRIRIALTEKARSMRPYPLARDIWDMIARSAYTQLRHSPLLLAGCVVGMGLLFLAPIWAALFGSFYATEAGMLAWLVMVCLYAPMIHFYNLPFVWSFTLPFAAWFYIGATVDSARRTWQGRGGQWKNRTQA